MGYASVPDPNDPAYGPGVVCNKCGCWWSIEWRLDGEDCRDEIWPDYFPCDGICKQVTNAARR